MSTTIALAGDTMLGREVGRRLETADPRTLFAPEIVEVLRGADLVVLNLECCISERGEPWPETGKPFFFRAPPAAVEALLHLGTDCVTLANNHALDYGYDALADTLELLDNAGIAHVGAGADTAQARVPALLHSNGMEVAVFGASDHPQDFAARDDVGGIAWGDFRKGAPEWLTAAIREVDADAVLATPHWGPNMTTAPSPRIRRAARDLLDAGATLAAGHSAHVFHGVEGRVLYDMGDFIDDYAVDRVLRNDLGLLFLVTLDGVDPIELRALPLKLEFCYTEVAQGEEAEWIRGRFRAACREFGTEVGDYEGWLTIALR